MDDLYARVRKRRQLEAAWRKIRENGRTSSSKDTRRSVAHFEQDETRNLERLQEQLQKRTFRFAPQIGIAAKKAKSSGRRPIVIAPLENRIIQRAVLDVAQSEIPAVASILEIPTSVGGIPKRGVGHALKIIDQQFRNGATFFVRSDISGFFTKIPRAEVTAFLEKVCDEPRFVELFERAMITELANIDAAGVLEHRDIFPIGPVGVAQGSPLSPLVGNILLRDFDKQMNDRGICCIRYIDDFLLLGPSEKKVRAAFRSASRMLESYDMTAYAPETNPDKADAGPVGNSFDFLGYQVSPGLFMPSKSARNRIDQRVQEIVKSAKATLKQVSNGSDSDLSRYRYCQTLKYLNDTLKGWVYAFQHTSSKQCLEEMDKKIDVHLLGLEKYVAKLIEKADPKTKRRLIGVFLLADLIPGRS